MLAVFIQRRRRIDGSIYGCVACFRRGMLCREALVTLLVHMQVSSAADEARS